jgi:hypothetical protein
VAWFWFDDKEDEWKHLADNQADADKYLPLKVVPLYTTPPAAQPAPVQNRSALTLDRQMTFGGCPFCGSQSCVAGQCRSATPPAAQRPWVGLTDEEAKKAFAEHNCDISKDLAGILARAIEAKLREKNIWT